MNKILFENAKALSSKTGIGQLQAYIAGNLDL